MALECGLDDAPLDAFAASVDQAHFSEAGFVGFADVLLNNRRDVTRCERVQINLILDRDPVLVPHQAFADIVR